MIPVKPINIVYPENWWRRRLGLYADIPVPVLWVLVGKEGGSGQGDRQTDTHTETHINATTQPGLGAGPSENFTLDSKVHP